MPDFNIPSLAEFVLLNARAIQIAQLAGRVTHCFLINKNYPIFETCGY
jgi:hypothetical protein